MSRFAPLKIRNFRLLWTGCFISWTGGEMADVAYAWILYQLTGSPVALGALGLMRAIPLVAFSLVGGSFADRLNRRNVILCAQIVQTAIAAVVLLCMLLQVVTPFVIYAAVLVEHSVLAFGRPARQSLVPQMVPKELFASAAQLTSTMWQFTMLLGPAVGGLLLGVYGANVVILVNLLSFLPYVVCLLLMKGITQVGEANAERSHIAAIAQGFRFVASKPIIFATMGLDFAVAFFAMAKTLFPIYADKILHTGATGLGVLYSAVAVGGIAAGVFVSPQMLVGRQGRALAASVCVIGLSTMVFAYSTHVGLSVSALFVLGAADFLNANIRMVIRQLSTPDHLRGRVAGIHSLVGGTGPMLGEMEAGVTAAILGTQNAVFVGGFMAVVAALLILKKVPQILSYK